MENANDTDETMVGRGIEVPTPFGKIRAKGYRMMDIVALGALCLMGLTTMLVWDHRAEAKDGSKEVAHALKEANKVVADTLKETTNNTNGVVKEMAQVIREMAQEQRETNCLLALPPDKRTPNAAEICRRASRGRDR